jgi:hypothetical protein
MTSCNACYITKRLSALLQPEELAGTDLLRSSRIAGVISGISGFYFSF